MHTHFSTDEGFVKAVNGVSFDIKKESVFGVVGKRMRQEHYRHVYYAVVTQTSWPDTFGHIFPRVTAAQWICPAGSYRFLDGGIRNEIAMIFRNP